MNALKPQHVGIKAIEIYFPLTYIEQSTLEQHDGVSAGKYTIGLGQTKMSICDDREDACSFALTAVSSLLRKYALDPKNIGRLEVGTESSVDKSKSIKSVLMQLFEKSGNSDIEGVDNVNACYGGTNALFNAANWVESSSWDGRDAIVVASDIAIYDKGSARPTGGAGCVAMLVGPNAPITFESGRRGSYMAHSYDFYKPDFTTEYPYVYGQSSIECYLQAVEACYRAYSKKESQMEKEPSICQRELRIPLDRFDYMCFHSPTYKLVVKAYSQLLYLDFLDNPTDPIFAEVPKYLRGSGPSAFISEKNTEKLFMKLASQRFIDRVQPSTEVPRMCGNMYTASVYGSLCSLLSNVEDTQLIGKRIGIFSYGSGLASSLFSLKVVGSTTGIVERLDIHRRLAKRIAISPNSFEEMCKQREMVYLKKSFKPDGNTFSLPHDVYFLAEVDEMFRRTYKKSA